MGEESQGMGEGVTGMEVKGYRDMGRGHRHGRRVTGAWVIPE